jgi:heat shock protein HslJ
MHANSVVAAGFRSLAGAALGLGACTSIAADHRSFEGTTWLIVAVDGKPGLDGLARAIRFQDGMISGSFGCDGFVGQYAVGSDAITVDDFKITERACPEYPDSFDRDGQAVLGSPMKMRWTSASRLTLSNRAGAIALERLP